MSILIRQAPYESLAMGEQMELQEGRKWWENKPTPPVYLGFLFTVLPLLQRQQPGPPRERRALGYPAHSAAQGTCFCSPKEGWDLNLSFYLFTLVCWFWQRLQILLNEFLLSFSPFRMSEMYWNAFIKDLDWLVLLNSSRGAQCFWGRDGPRREPPSLPSAGLAHLSSQMSRFCLRLSASAGGGPVPAVPRFLFAFVLFNRWLSPSCKHSFVLSGWFLFDMFFTSGLGDHVFWQCPHPPL